LVAYAGLPVTGRYHRAQADAEMAAHPTLYLERALMAQFGLQAVTHALLGRIQRVPKSQLQSCIARHGEASAPVNAREGKATSGEKNEKGWPQRYNPPTRQSL
jgi:hypothetical protein